MQQLAEALDLKGDDLVQYAQFEAFYDDLDEVDEDAEDAADERRDTLKSLLMNREAVVPGEYIDEDGEPVSEAVYLASLDLQEDHVVSLRSLFHLYVEIPKKMAAQDDSNHIVDLTKVKNAIKDGKAGGDLTVHIFEVFFG